jgi:hypothetical protein
MLTNMRGLRSSLLPCGTFFDGADRRCEPAHIQFDLLPGSRVWREALVWHAIFDKEAMSGRQCRRHRERCKEDRLEGLLDPHPGKPSPRRVSAIRLMPETARGT